MSKHFTLDEFIRSRMAQDLKIDNSLPEGLLVAANQTLAGLERIRAFLGQPVTLNSGYRCPALNKLVGGADDSQHMRAEAADILCLFHGSPSEVARALLPARFILGIDQLILEPTWVHVSFTADPRYQAMRAVGGGRYVPLIPT